MRSIGSVSPFAIAALIGLLFAVNPAQARSRSRNPPRRYAFLAGGAGETEDNNFFIQDLRDFGARLSARGWKVRAAVGSRDRLLSGSVKATGANIAREARESLTRARRGDEVLLVFHAHGMEREETWGQRTHSIICDDSDSSGDEPGFDLDALEPWILAARAHGAQVALIDLSCYSGATQAIRGPSCTITLAAPHYISLCSGRPEERTFSSHFFDLPRAVPPADLETQFLSARRRDRDSINLPQISSRSTPAAGGWDAFLQEVDPLDVYEDLRNFRTGAKPFDAEKLMREIAAAGASPLVREILSRLDTALEIRSKLEDAMPRMAKGYDQRSLTLELPERDPLPISPGNLIDLLEQAEKKPTEIAALDGYTAVQRRLVLALSGNRLEVERRFGKPLFQFSVERDAYEALAKGLEDAAGKLFESEREFYGAFSIPIAPRNRCQEFKI